MSKVRNMDEIWSIKDRLANDNLTFLITFQNKFFIG